MTTRTSAGLPSWLAAPIVVLTVGCIGPGRVIAIGAQRDIHFEFSGDILHRAPEVVAIDVFKLRGEEPGDEVCTARLPDSAWRHPPRMTTWTYGQDLSTKVPTGNCQPLASNQPYRIGVHLADRRVIGTDFQLAPDGAVIDLIQRR